MGVLTGRTALITGASRGIGRATAVRLGREGARVAVHYGSNEEAARQTVAAVEAAGGTAFMLGADLTAPGAAEALWRAFDAEADGVDVIVNNAGLAVFKTVEETEEADFETAFALNAKAPFFVAKHGLSRLRDGGRIINVTGPSRIALPAIAATVMAKGAVNTLTRNLARHLAPRGITVNSVTPGITETDLAAYLADPAMREWGESFSAFGRVGRPEDIADVIAFLASDDARWVTGQEVDATGGAMLGL
ncbi:3-oxoacyl-[acyl-carrier protein] reductase [Streptomyces olivoverticillatus]|uniref:3-oxoacyl-[acyl-carrier protein] reductase n=1 Tax=Streptomyces olivoverticillatus TaxID=66427 RepID=A0A7W7LJG3_9ACTN|nr:SDR family oxidoreductase [Streptomyces olivoverticillatus]MBB4891372.1 3-oxoacyl-[acyl-carrier protein] reductase [Streptomyces olivoverticillatus]